MSNFNIERSKSEVQEVKKEIVEKKEYAMQLENNKQNILDMGSSIQGSDNLDDKTQRKIMDYINQELEANSEKAKDAANELNEQQQKLNEVREKTEDSITENESETKKIQQKKSLLDKFGLGKGMENAINELENNKQELGDLKEFVTESDQELSKVSAKLNTI